METTINYSLFQFIQFTAILLTGLISGLFYGYDCSVVKGLGNVQTAVYLQSFQSINSAIQNPWFFASFLGCLVVLPALTWLSYANAGTIAFYLLLSASLVYLIGVFGVTIFVNVPLNERLANFSMPGATEHEMAIMRKAFEAKWNNYNSIRTIASIISFSLTIFALLKQKPAV